ncbi:hypothetical protein BDA96_10G295600 [Sorghum bicolor]|uniref:Uncharacterized protein n=1 Tax=Sorghum bicolor TaxID=4558 RepID=A0A921U2L9_SORBI|nr:hypothetical protein BDA96_10G295600 [Sorghum bicolor]
MLLGDAGGRAKPNRRLLSRRGCGSAGRQLLALPSSSILPPELKTHVVVPLHACRPVPEPPSPARSSRSTCVCSFSPVQFSRLYESLRESIGWLFGCGIVLPIRHQLLAGQLGGSHACTCTQPGKEEERAHARPWPAAFSPSKRRACDEMHVLQKPSKRKFPRSSRAGAPSIPWCTSTSTTTIEYVRQCYRRRRRAGGGDDDDEDDGRDVVGSTDDWEEEARGRTTKACNSRTVLYVYSVAPLPAARRQGYDATHMHPIYPALLHARHVPPHSLTALPLPEPHRVAFKTRHLSYATPRELNNPLGRHLVPDPRAPNNQSL